MVQTARFNTWQTLVHYQQEWNSEAVVRARVTAEKALRAKAATPSKRLTPLEEVAVGNVIRYFNAIAFLINRFDLDIAWSHYLYYSEASEWWELAKWYIDEGRAMDPTVWSEYRTLMAGMEAFKATEKRRLGLG
jgi:hypothetical protein